jgi:hypothetical protein
MKCPHTSAFVAGNNALVIRERASTRKRSASARFSPPHPSVSAAGNDAPPVDECAATRRVRHNFAEYRYLVGP